ncbi:hypothetical protein [Saccharopolyspora tripterygii]
MEFQDTIDYVLENLDSIGVARGIEGSWEVYDRESLGEFVGAITEEGLDLLRSNGVEVYRRGKETA